MSKRKKEYAVDVLKREIEARKTKLKPCPFCGGEAIYDKSKGYDSIFCDECGARSFGFTKEQAFDEWNKRVDIADTYECCEKSCKDENATCKKSLQVSRSDIEKMVKLDWHQHRSNGWCTYINSGRITIIEENVYVIYFEDYKIWSAISLEQAQTIAKDWVVDFICSALGVEE